MHVFVLIKLDTSKNIFIFFFSRKRERQRFGGGHRSRTPLFSCPRLCTPHRCTRASVAPFATRAECHSSRWAGKPDRMAAADDERGRRSAIGPSHRRERVPAGALRRLHAYTRTRTGLSEPPPRTRIPQHPADDRCRRRAVPEVDAAGRIDRGTRPTDDFV